MKPTTRRIALLIPMVSLTGTALFGAYAQQPAPQKPQVSFKEAQAKVGKIVAEEIAASEKDFGVQYTPREVARIQASIWSTVRHGLNEVYAPTEKEE